MNKVILMGRLTRDPDVRYSNQGDRQLAIARYTLAVDRKFRRNSDSNEQTADFISCIAFDRQAEFAERYLKKGTKLVITGRLQTGSYTNKDGIRISTTDVVIEEQEFAESRSSVSGSSAQTGSPAQRQNRSSQGNQDLHNTGYPRESSGNGSPGCDQNSGGGYHPSYEDYMNIPEEGEEEGLPFH
ncbi:MAG: single-stranded DNA-binding protein [Lachnospiraceae bacterium]|nr:single-stranded DNA-binding protein [Lachnospiraceae bacterium]